MTQAGTPKKALPAAAQGGIPKAVLVGAALLIGFAITASSAAHLTDIGTSHMPDAKPVATLALRFEDRNDGSVAVRDIETSREVYHVEPGTNGFIRATVRGLVRERKRAGIDEVQPFTLTHWDNGTLSLVDSTTGRRVNLEAFGPTNAEAFAQFFKSGETSK